jgi:hypothetical protein
VKCQHGQKGDRNLNGYDLEIDKIRLISEEIDKNDMNVEMYQAIGNSMTQNDMNAEMYQEIGNSTTYMRCDLVIKNLT